MMKHAEILFNVARLSILGTVAVKPNCDANHIINITGISPSKVYRDLKTLTDTDFITATSIRTGSGYKKMTCKAKYNTISFVLHKDKTILDLRVILDNKMLTHI